MEEPEKKQNYFVPASVVIAGILISASVIYVGAIRKGGDVGVEQAAFVGGAVDGSANGNVASVNAPTSRDVILGNPNAPVTYIEYGDYQCPFCARLFSQVDSLVREEYVKTDKVKMVYRNFVFLGPESLVAAEAAECAKDQKQFWAYHDLLYQRELEDGAENNGNLNRELFMDLAGKLNLNATEFAKCFDGKKYAKLIEEDSAAARDVGVNSTPTVYVNGELVRGALPYEQFKSIIEQALAARQ